MALNRNQRLSHLRNLGLYTSRADAYTALSNLASESSNINDGEIILARYGGSITDSKVLFGAFHKKDTTSKVQILDSTDDIILSGDTLLSITSSVTDGVVTWKIDTTPIKTQLDAISAATSGDVKTVVVNGITGATSNNTATVNIGAKDVKLSGYTIATAEAALATSDTINDALGKLEKGANNLAAADTTIKTAVGLKSDGTYSANTAANYISSATSVQDALIALDTAIHGVDGDMQSEFTEVENEIVCMKTLIGLPSGDTCTDKFDGTNYLNIENANVLDGMIALDTALKSVSSATPTSVTIASKTMDSGASTKYITSVTTENGQVKSVGSADISVSVNAAAGTGNVLSSYTVSVNGKTATTTIDIPKDRTLISVSLGHTSDTINEGTGVVSTSDTGNLSLNFVHYLHDGKYSLTKIDVASFLANAQYGNGLVVNDGVVNVDIATSSPLKFNAANQLTIEDIDCGTYGNED